ncbi:MAG: hypothetical protein ABI633_09185, partial [Burkholderiales bacterium]
PFKPDDALVQLQRTLRGMRGLVERGAGFEWNGRPVVMLAVDGEALQARLAKRPATSPEWEARTLRNGADVRRFGDDVKRRIDRWKDGDE